MDKEKFSAVMGILVSQTVSLIMMNYSWDEKKALDEFYRSDVYAALECEDAKVWHFSPQMIFCMFDSEVKTGAFEFPEEG